MFETNPRLERLKAKIRDGKPVIGVFVLLGDAAVSEIVGMSGCDFAWIDAEHGTLDRKAVKDHIVYAQSAGACAFVRVPGVEPDQIKNLLDCGPDGVIFPNIATRDMAERAVAACTYPTDGGMRGVGPGRVIRYGIDPEIEYLNNGRDTVWKILQIESLQGAENMADIAKVPGIHSLFIGPADLSMTMRAAKYPESETNDRIRAIQVECGALCKENGLFAGSCAGPTGESCKNLMALGMHWMTIAQDIRLLSLALSAAVKDIHG